MVTYNRTAEAAAVPVVTTIEINRRGSTFEIATAVRITASSGRAGRMDVSDLKSK